MELSGKEIWVYAEATREGILNVGLELVGKGKGLAEKGRMSLAAVLMGDAVGGFAQELIHHGADKVYVCESPIFRDIFIQAEGKALFRMIHEIKPEIVLFGATSKGIQLAPMVAALLGTGLSAHCIDLDIDEEGRLLQIVPGFGGNIMARILCPCHRPQMATVQPGAFKIPERKERNGDIVRLPVDIQLQPEWPRVMEFRKETREEEAPLKNADVVVAGGWGIGDREGWKLLDELASLLGGAVGATRPALDEGWAEEDQMIGQSGITVRPRFYMGVAISGSMHHMVGVQDAGFMMAINKDPKAPIFDMCDLAVEGDYRKILPILIEKIREAKKR
ncbi:MAG: electron transfer flavoprotein subunit alpha/FixB family protein [Candidatus Bathyarchaeia archaeon]